MIGYVTVGTNDKERALKFYDEIFKIIGIGRLWETDQFTSYGAGLTEPQLSVTIPYDKKPATVGNGNMVAIFVDSTEKVDAMYKKAIELGAQDEGPAGARGEGGFYAGYFRDMDGNKLNVFTITKDMSEFVDESTKE
tara:strand:- start:232 stop:642 length:411 start_codon:yes stop_codon:yes gene_type:complete